MEAELQREGWYLSEKGLQYCKDLCSNRNPTAKEIIANALHTDIRQIGKQILPADINKGKDSEINGPIVLQIQKVRNVSAPTAKEDSSFAPRMLKFTLTDGVITCTGLEIEIIHSVSLTSPPGSKIKLVGTIKIQHGFLLLNSYSLKLLGGDVEQLKTKWEISQNVGKMQRKVLTAEGGPPLFVPFEESDFARQRPTKAQTITKKEPNFKAPPKGNVQNTKIEKGAKPFEEKKIWKSEPLKTRRDKNPTNVREDREEKRETKKIIEVNTGPKTDQQNKTADKKRREQQDQKSQARWKDKDTKETEKEKRQSTDYQRNDKKEFKNDFTRTGKKEFKRDGERSEKRETVKEHKRDETREVKKDENRFEKRVEAKEDPKNDKRVDKRESKKEYTRNGRNGQRNDFPKIENKGHKEYQRNERKNPASESTKSWKNECDAKTVLRNPKNPEAEVDCAANAFINEKQNRDDFQNRSGGARMRSDKQEFKNQNQHKSGLPPRMERLRHGRRDDFEPVARKSENAGGKYEKSGANNKDVEGMRADLVKKAEEVAASRRVPSSSGSPADVLSENAPLANVPRNVPRNVPSGKVSSGSGPSESVPPEKKKSEDLLDKDMEQVLVLLNEKMRIDGGNKARGEERRNGRQRNENTTQSGGRLGGRQGEWKQGNDRGVKEILKSGVDREKPTDRHDQGQKTRYSEKRNAKFNESKRRASDEGNVNGEKDAGGGSRENFSSMNIEIIKREERVSVQLQQHTKTAWTNEDVAAERNDDGVSKDDEKKQTDKVAQFMTAVVTANRPRSIAGREYQPDSSTLPQSIMHPQAMTQSTIQQPMITSSGQLMYSYLPTYPSAMYQQNVSQIYQTAPSQVYQTTPSQAFQSMPGQAYQSAQSQAYLSSPSQGYQSAPSQAYQRISSQEFQQMLPQGYNAQMQQVHRYQQTPSSTMYLQQSYGLQSPGLQSLNHHVHFPGFAPQDQHSGKARVKHDIYRPKN